MTLRSQRVCSVVIAAAAASKIDHMIRIMRVTISTMLGPLQALELEWEWCNPSFDDRFFGAADGVVVLL